MEKTILVTGATGFIGHHLVSKLRPIYPLTLAVRNRQNCDDANLRIVDIGDIDGETDWQEALQGIDVVIHLAARAHQLNDTAVNPQQLFDSINTEGTKNLAQQSIRAGVKHFIFISSIGAMATLSESILTDESACQPDTPYGCSKLAAEKSLMELSQNSDMTWTILRPTLVYGPGNPGNMDRLMKLVKTGLPLPFGSFHNRRSFIYVGNLVDIILKAVSHPKAQNQTFLCSDGDDLSTTELIQQIAKCADRRCSLLPVPLSLLRLGGGMLDILQNLLGRSLSVNSETIARLMGSLWVDNSKLYSHLEWTPLYSIEEGLTQTFHE
ncbi:MAG: NAD-dependent epimerase/dehydratase family protein [Cyanobacteria bacterium P01_F01_bin.150]